MKLFFSFLFAISPSMGTATLRRSKTLERKLQTVSSATLAAAKADILTVIEDNRNIRIAPKFVRLGFHDCVGGCDGCVDLANADNNGLGIPIDALEPVYQTYAADGLSRADVWALAAFTAAEDSQDPDNPQFTFPFTHVGRLDCPSGDFKGGPDRHLPPGDLTTHEILDFFSVNFNFTARDTVVIMGGHSFGVLSADNSGYPGPNGWVGPSRLFDASFHNALTGNNRWFPMSTDNGDADPANDRHFWTKEVTLLTDEVIEIMMLNADMALVRDFSNHKVLDDNGDWTGEVSCHFESVQNKCPMAAETADMVEEYAGSPEVFVPAFIDTFGRMLQHGYDLDENCLSTEVCELTPIVGFNLTGTE